MRDRSANNRSRQAPSGPFRGQQGLPAEEERRLRRIDVEPLAGASLEHGRDLGVLGEAVARDHAVEVRRQRLDPNAVRLRHVRLRLRAHREEHDALVQHLVVPQVVEQRLRHAAGSAPGTRPSRRRASAARPELAAPTPKRDRRLRDPLGEDPASGVPRGHDREDRRGDDEREPAAARDLGQARRPEPQVDDEEARGERDVAARPHFHRARATTAKRIVVNTMSVVTATP